MVLISWPAACNYHHAFCKRFEVPGCLLATGAVSEITAVEHQPEIKYHREPFKQPPADQRRQFLKDCVAPRSLWCKRSFDASSEADATSASPQIRTLPSEFQPVSPPSLRGHWAPRPCSEKHTPTLTCTAALCMYQKYKYGCKTNTKHTAGKTYCLHAMFLALSRLREKNVTLPPTHVPASSCALPEQSALANSEDLDRRQEKRSTRRPRAALSKNSPIEDRGTKLEKICSWKPAKIRKRWGESTPHSNPPCLYFTRPKQEKHGCRQQRVTPHTSSRELLKNSSNKSQMFKNINLKKKKFCAR